jgi:hypothetical protein
MAEPVTKKIDTLPAMTDAVATNDKLLLLDVSAPATTKTKLITMNQVRISSAAQLDANVVENAKIKDGAVTSGKLATGAVTAGKIASGGVSASSQFAAEVVDTVALKDLNVTGAKIANATITNDKLATGAVTAGKIASGGISASTQFAAGVVNTAALKDLNVTGAKIANATITNDKLAAEVINDINKNLVYIQLFQPDEAVITTSAKAYFFVPSYLAGKKVKQLGIGIVSSSTGKTVTVALGSSYGSVSGVTSAETANTLNYTLPAALTKIPINVTVTAGTPAPQGLDFWFLVI